MENQKLTQRPQAATITENALIHVAEPFDISQGPDGSSYKFPVANLFVAGQDNIDIKKYVFIEDDDNLNVIVSKINSLPQYEVNEKQSVWFIASSGKRLTQGLYSPQRILKFKMMNKGKGKYGVGAIQLIADDIELMYSNEETLSDIGADPVTDIVNYGALESEGQTLSQWLNSRNSEIVIQTQNEGYTIFQGTVDAIPASYLWIGQPGVYGVGEQQSTEADFQVMDDTIPQYDNNSPFIRNIGLIETMPVSQGMRAKLNQLTTVITPIDTPVLFKGYTVGETGAGTAHTFLFMGGKGTWGVGGNNILLGMLYPLLEKPLGTGEVEDNDTTRIIPLGEIDGGSFLVAVNAEEHDFTVINLEYYFSYYIDDILYLALFIGTPGVYGGGMGSDDFENADFAQVTNGNISDLPTLQQVNAEGNGTTNPLTVKDISGIPKLSHRSDRLIFTDVENIEHEYPFSQYEGNRVARINEVIPITGTTEDNPVTGDIEFAGPRRFINGDTDNFYSMLQLNNSNIGLNSIDTPESLYSGIYISPFNISGNVYSSESNSSFAMGATGISMTVGNPSEGVGVNMGLNTNQLLLDFNDPASKGISGSADYTSNIGDLDYAQKKYVDNTVAGITLQTVAQNGSESTIALKIIYADDLPYARFYAEGFDVYGGETSGTQRSASLRLEQYGGGMYLQNVFGGVVTLQTSNTSDIVSLLAPTVSGKLAVESYVDNAVAGLFFKNECVVATTTNITLSGVGFTIDGYLLNFGDRILVKNQTIAYQNGIYIVGGGAWSRASDADTGSELENKTIPVTSGTVNQDTWWTITNDSIILGTTAITLSQTGGMGTYTNGTGIQLAGNIFSADPSYIATAVASALAGKEPTINAGITGQYWRGDKTWQALNKSVIGLGNVDNTSDANKPVSTAQQTALDGKLTNGGDTTGAVMNIGSNDAQAVNIKYNNTPVITIPSANGIGLPNGASITNASSSGRGTILMGTTGAGITIQRNSADAVAGLTATVANNSSTGNIAEFLSNISSTIAIRAFITKTGQVNAPSFKLSALNTAPSSSTDTGTTGEIRVTAAYIYVCVATNTWVRSALTTW